MKTMKKKANFVSYLKRLHMLMFTVPDFGLPLVWVTCAVVRLRWWVGMVVRFVSV